MVEVVSAMQKRICNASRLNLPMHLDNSGSDALGIGRSRVILLPGVIFVTSWLIKHLIVWIRQRTSDSQGYESAKIRALRGQDGRRAAG